MLNWALMSLSYMHFDASIQIVVTTNNLVHLTMYHTFYKPDRHKDSIILRGLAVPWGAYFCFVSTIALEQEEAGDTLTHTFLVPNWEYCQTKYFAFLGTVGGVESPSISALFEHHHSGVPGLQTEEQTTGILWSSILDGAGWGQKLPISNRLLSNLSFYLKRVGNPAGYVGYWIRKVSDDSLIWQRILMNSNLISTIPQWYPLAIDPPILLNEEVRLITYATSNGAGNLINIWMSPVDIKPDEHAFFRYATGVYTEHPTWDFMYQYIYQQY